MRRNLVPKWNNQLRSTLNQQLKLGKEADEPEIYKQSSRMTDALNSNFHEPQVDDSNTEALDEARARGTGLEKKSLDAKDHSEQEDSQMKWPYEGNERSLCNKQEIARLQEELMQLNLRTQKLKSVRKRQLESQSSLDAKDRSEKEDYQMKMAYKEKEREASLLEERIQKLESVLKRQLESQSSLDAKDCSEKEDYQMKMAYKEREWEVSLLEERAHSNKQEIARLHEELKKLNLRAQTLESENETLKRKPELQRDASISERRVGSDGRRTENTLSTNRQSELEEEYITDLKDGLRCDAIEMILDAQKRNRKSDEKATMKAYRLSCFIFEVAYDIATRVHNNFKAISSRTLETLANETPAIGINNSLFIKILSSQSKQVRVQDALTEVLVLVKESATNHNLHKLYQFVKATVEEKWRRSGDGGLPCFDFCLSKELENYIEHCTRFVWRMVTQLPPLRIDCSSQTYNPKKHIKSQAFSSSSTASCEKVDIKCYLWPTLCDWDGRVIQRGEVIVRNRQK